MNRTGALAIVAALGLCPVLVGARLPLPASASAAGGTTCNYVHDIEFDPGLGVRPTNGMYRRPTKNESTITDCTGPFLGIDMTGPGTFVIGGTYGNRDPDTCHGLDGDAEGFAVFTFPTADGPRSVRSVYTVAYGGPADAPGGLIALKVVSKDWYAEESVVPLKGDCLLNPMTLARGTGVFTTRR